MTAVRTVGPRKACDAGSSSPSYASTSVNRTATRAPPTSETRTAPSSRGAITSAGCASRSRSTVTGGGPSRSGPGGLLMYPLGQRGQLLGYPGGRCPADGRPGAQGTGHREHRADIRCEPWVDFGQFVVGELAEIEPALL